MAKTKRPAPKRAGPKRNTRTTNYDNFKHTVEMGKRARAAEMKKIAAEKKERGKMPEYQPKIIKFDTPIPYEDLHKYI